KIRQICCFWESLSLLILDGEIAHTEKATLVPPYLLDRKSTCRGQLRKIGIVIFVTRFGVDRLTGIEMNTLSIHVYGLLAAALRMHLDTRLSLVIKGNVLEIFHLEIRAETTIQMREHVEVEGGRHAGAVVVGRLDNPGRLGQIHADECRAAGSGQSGKVLEQFHRVFRLEIADGGAGKINDSTLLRSTRRRHVQG